MINSLFNKQFWRGSFWPAVEACYSRTWTGYSMRPHFHNRAELMYVLKGTSKIHLFFAEEQQRGAVSRVTKRRVDELRMGDFIFLDAGVMHALEVQGSCYMANVEFAVENSEAPVVTLCSLREASDYFRTFLDTGKGIVRGFDPDGSVYSLLTRVIEEFVSTEFDPRQKPALDLALASLLLELACKIRTIEGNTAMKYALHAARLLHERMQDNVRIDDIAQEIGINASYLQRLFKKEMNCTLIEYLNDIRIERAKVLLSITNDPIVDIAMAIGYNSRQHFSCMFTKKVKMSPNEYRKSAKNEQNKQLFLFDRAPADGGQYGP